jgi:hypothetical protein
MYVVEPVYGSSRHRSAASTMCGHSLRVRLIRIRLRWFQWGPFFVPLCVSRWRHPTPRVQFMAESSLGNVEDHPCESWKAQFLQTMRLGLITADQSHYRSVTVTNHITDLLLITPSCLLITQNIQLTRNVCGGSKREFGKFQSYRSISRFNRNGIYKIM